MTIEQMKDEAISRLRGELQKEMAAKLARVEEIRLVLELTDPVRRRNLRAVEAVRRDGIG